MTYWANFAKTGNPNVNPNGSWTPVYWPLHTERNKEFLMLSVGNMTSGKGHRARKCAFWRHYLPKLLGEKSLYLTLICKDEDNRDNKIINNEDKPTFVSSPLA